MKFGAVNCDKNGDLCSENGVEGYPTLKLFTGSKVTEYASGNSVTSISQFLRSQRAHKLHVSAVSDSGHVKSVDDVSLQKYIESSDFVVVDFYASWCPHCKLLKPIYKQLAEIFHSDGVIFLSIDGEKYDKVMSRYKIDGYPTILFFKNGHKHEYKNANTLEKLVHSVNKHFGLRRKHK